MKKTSFDPSQENPLLLEVGIPNFAAVLPEHIEPAMTEVLRRCTLWLEEAERLIDPQWENLFPLLDQINRTLQRSWGTVNHLINVATTDSLRDAHEKIQPYIVEFSLRYSQSQILYRSYEKIQSATKPDSAEKKVRLRVLEANIRDAKLSGIGLPEEKRKRFNEIVNQLSTLSTKFANNVLDATKAYTVDLTSSDEVKGLPPSALAMLSQNYRIRYPAKNSTPESGPWTLTLDGPSFTAFMQHAQSRTLRESTYRAYVTRASKDPYDNSQVIVEILNLRTEMAQILGYSNYGEVSLVKKMAPNLEAVDRLSEDLLAAAYPHAKKELQELCSYASSKGEVRDLELWDIAFWSERLREHLYELDDESLKPFFSLDHVLTGLFKLVNRLFEIDVRAADGEAPVWHEDVRFFKIFDKNNAHLASFYLDPYSRPSNKRGGAWMDDCLGREWVNGKLQIPVAHLVCNSTPPTQDLPSLMTFREVETLFHEFGHGLQRMLTRVDIPQAAGIAGVEWDAVELPSQFMENWCYHEPTLLSFAKHYQTGASLDHATFKKLVRAKNYHSGLMNLRQLRFGMMDMALHTSKKKPLSSSDVLAIANEVSRRTSLMPPLPEDRVLCSFSHIFAGGYAAGYYSYKWAEVLSADAFAAFEEVGLADAQKIAQVGRLFRETILSLGGGTPPMEVYQSFRGREPNIDALLRHTGLRD